MKTSRTSRALGLSSHASGNPSAQPTDPHANVDSFLPAYEELLPPQPLHAWEISLSPAIADADRFSTDPVCAAFMCNGEIPANDNALVRIIAACMEHPAENDAITYLNERLVESHRFSLEPAAKIHSLETAPLVAWLATNPPISTLRFTTNYISSALTSALETNSTLTELSVHVTGKFAPDLRGCWREFDKALDINQTLQRVSIDADYEMASDGPFCIPDCMLQKLQRNRNQLAKALVAELNGFREKEFLALLRQKCLTRLDLRNQVLYEVGVKALAAALLRDGCPLKELTLGTVASFSPVCDSLTDERCKVEYLDVSHLRIGRSMPDGTSRYHPLLSHHVDKIIPRLASHQIKVLIVTTGIVPQSPGVIVAARRLSKEDVQRLQSAAANSGVSRVHVVPAWQ